MPITTQNIAVRYPKPMVERCKRIAAANGIKFADVIRIAVSRELPRLEAGSFELNGVAQKAANA